MSFAPFELKKAPNERESKTLFKCKSEKEKAIKKASKCEIEEIQEQLYPEFAKYRLIEHRNEFQNYKLETFLGIFRHWGAHSKHILTFLIFL